MVDSGEKTLANEIAQDFGLGAPTATLLQNGSNHDCSMQGKR